MRTLSALFTDFSDAERAAVALQEIGIPQASVTISGSGPTDTTATYDKGFWESLGDLFFPDDDRESYAEGMRRGGYLLVARDLDEVQVEQATEILDDEGTVNLDEQTATWRAEGWHPETPVTTPGAALGAAETITTPTETVIPVVEERLVVGKRDTSGGSTRVRSYVVDKPVEEGVTLREQHVEVERRPADRPATEADLAAREQTVEAEDRQEEVVVGKEQRVVEEVVVRTEADQRTETVSDTVRETKVDVDKDPTPTPSAPTPRKATKYRR